MPLTWRCNLASAIPIAGVAVVLTMGGGRAEDASLKALAQRFLATNHCEEGAAAVGYIDNGVGSIFSVGTVAAHGGNRREIRDTDEFAIGSITKTFTAALYALALREGKVRPDTPAQELMPDGVSLPVYKGSNGQETPITLDSLARHSSGLPRGLGADGGDVGAAFGGLSREQMIADLRTARLQFAPGTRFLYSNLGFAVLAMAMERAYGGKIETLLAQKIAAPLQLSSTTFDLDAVPPDTVLDGYRPNGAQAREHEPTWPAFDGAIGLRSTAGDMMKYLRFNMRLASSGELDGILPTLQKTHTLRGAEDGKTREIGLAWQFATLPDGGKLIWKDGNVPGFRSFIGFTPPPLAVGAFVLTTQNGCRATKLGRCVVELVSHARADDYCLAPNAGGRGPSGGVDSSE